MRESHICSKIIFRSKLFSSKEKILFAMKENNELISIFVKSVETAQKTAKARWAFERASGKDPKKSNQ